MNNPPKRPPTRAVGPARVQVLRGPRNDDGVWRWYWRARVYGDGGERTIWTGWGTVREADAAVAKLIADGERTRPKRPAAEVCRTVRDVLELWVGSRETASERGELREVSLQRYRSVARALADRLGDLRVDAVALSTLEGYRDHRARADVRMTTVAGELRLLEAAWRWAMERDFGVTRPLPVVRIKAAPLPHYTPDAVEVAAVLGRLRGWSWLAVRLLFATGCRPGELAHARVSDLDLARGVLHVDGKTGPRDVPLAPAVLAEIAPLLGGPDAYLLGRAPSYVRSRLPRILRELQIGWTPKALRRRAVDTLYGAGVDVSVAAAILGHSPAVALRHYRHPTEQDRALAAQAARLGYLTEPEPPETPPAQPDRHTRPRSRPRRRV